SPIPASLEMSRKRSIFAASTFRQSKSPGYGVAAASGADDPTADGSGPVSCGGFTPAVCDPWYVDDQCPCTNTLGAGCTELGTAERESWAAALDASIAAI